MWKLGRFCVFLNPLALYKGVEQDSADMACADNPFQSARLGAAVETQLANMMSGVVLLALVQRAVFLYARTLRSSEI
jgi:hypothetical protein